MYPGGWAVPPHSWARMPEERLLARETLEQVRAAIAKLPPRQQEVIVLRDVEGWEPEEVSQALDADAGQPARAAAPRALEGPRRARALLRGRGA